MGQSPSWEGSQEIPHITAFTSARHLHLFWANITHKNPIKDQRILTEQKHIFISMKDIYVVLSLSGKSSASEFYVPEAYTTYENGTVFRNVGSWNSDSGELPKRKNKAKVWNQERLHTHTHSHSIYISIHSVFESCSHCSIFFFFLWLFTDVTFSIGRRKLEYFLVIWN